MNLLKTEIAFPPELMDTVFMRLGFIILPGVLLTLSACGRGELPWRRTMYRRNGSPKAAEQPLFWRMKQNRAPIKRPGTPPPHSLCFIRPTGTVRGCSVSTEIHRKQPLSAVRRRTSAPPFILKHPRGKSASMKSASHPRMETRHGCPAGLIRNSPVRDTAPERPAPLPSRTTHPGSQTCP